MRASRRASKGIVVNRFLTCATLETPTAIFMTAKKILYMRLDPVTTASKLFVRDPLETPDKSCN